MSRNNGYDLTMKQAKKYDIAKMQKVWPEYVKARDEIFYRYYGSDWSEEYLKLPPMIRFMRRQILLNDDRRFISGRFAMCRDFEDVLIGSLENMQDRKYILFDKNCATVQCEISRLFMKKYPDEYKGAGNKKEDRAFCRRYELKVSDEEE